MPKAPPAKGNFLSRKTGGIPNVVLIAGGGLLIYVYLSKKNAAASATATNPAAAQAAALAAQQQSYQQAMAASAYYPAQGSASAQQPVYVVNGSPSGTPAAGTPSTDQTTPVAGAGSGAPPVQNVNSGLTGQASVNTFLAQNAWNQAHGYNYYTSAGEVAGSSGQNAPPGSFGSNTPGG